MEMGVNDWHWEMEQEQAPRSRVSIISGLIRRK